MAVVQIVVVLPHTQGSIRIQAELVFMENAIQKYFIFGERFLSFYRIDIVQIKEEIFTIWNENKKKKFSPQDTRPILPIYRDMVPEDNLRKQKENKNRFIIDEGIK